jgi:hypothetical protein
VTALGKVVVVVVVVVTSTPREQGATGATVAPGATAIVVVALHRRSGATVELVGPAGTDDVVVVAARETIGAIDSSTREATTALTDRERRTYDTLVSKVLPHWSFSQRY